jgi:hypothetical protein
MEYSRGIEPEEVGCGPLRPDRTVLQGAQSSAAAADHRCPRAGRRVLCLPPRVAAGAAAAPDLPAAHPAEGRRACPRPPEWTEHLLLPHPSRSGRPRAVGRPGCGGFSRSGKAKGARRRENRRPAGLPLPKMPCPSRAFEAIARRGGRRVTRLFAENLHDGSVGAAPAGRTCLRRNSRPGCASLGETALHCRTGGIGLVDEG